MDNSPANTSGPVGVSGREPPSQAPSSGQGLSGTHGRHAAAQTAKKRRRLSPGKRLLLKFCIIVGIFAVVFIFVLGIHIQRGNDMYPFLRDGDLLITYKLEAYREGDVILYRSPLSGEKRVSRIVAIGPSEIRIAEIGHLLVNGYVPDEQVFYATRQLPDSKIEFPYSLSADSCFVLDDFRTQGKDSRLFGELKEDDLLGKVVFLFRRRGI